MPEYTDAAVPTAAAPTELKSTDTSNRPKPAPEPAPPVAEPPKVEAKEPEPEGAPEGGDDAPSADDQRSDRKKDRLPRWVQERMERVRRVTEAETRERVLREVQPTQAPAPEPEAKAKTLADFDFDQEAYTEYKVELAIERREQKARAEAEQRKQAEAAETFKARIDSFEDRAGAGAWEDIQTSVLNTDPKYKPLVDMFMGDEHDLDIAHHLAVNEGEAARLLSLSPLARVRELAKLADSFGAPSQVEKPAPVIERKITSAPPPTRTIPSASLPKVDVSAPDISTAARIAEWKKARKS